MYKNLVFLAAKFIGNGTISLRLFHKMSHRSKLRIFVSKEKLKDTYLHGRVV